MDRKALRIGVNLGGWISQYPAYDHDHFKSFITCEDIQRIADWGFDHVRLPVDYPVIEDDDQPGVFKESGGAYIESCLEWCHKNKLRLIIDLHKAPGYQFDAHKDSPLFESLSLQERFLAIWQAITQRFAGRMDDLLAFELLNEVFLPYSGPWNALIRQAVEHIRSLDSQRLIVIGGNRYNAPSELQNLKVMQDSNILYTFHFYAPLSVTHQKAPWVQALVEYNQEVEYPGQAPDLEAFLRAHPEYQDVLEPETGKWFDKTYLQSVLQPALDFSQHYNQPLYCGEFGVYERASMRTRQNWNRDLVSLLNISGIGRAYWSYKDLDFGLVDRDGKIVNQELVKIVSQP
jgi:aryl-phospho-beta-D-glucosidase BglC (GH1 family)